MSFVGSIVPGAPLPQPLPRRLPPQPSCPLASPDTPCSFSLPHHGFHPRRHGKCLHPPHPFHPSGSRALFSPSTGLPESSQSSPNVKIAVRTVTRAEPHRPDTVSPGLSRALTHSIKSKERLIVSGLTFRSLIHFEFIFVYGVGECSNFILLHVPVQFSQHHLLKRLSFLHCICLPPLSKIR